ncbi:sphingosine-1-phosphate phosphatase [Cryptococcus neoformans 125.91]|nr:sphingosine-1-phosphate phosphatase [Cryptococcus neoformans var. grubii 125.91]
MRSSPVIEISPPSSGTAIFQHNPKGDATLRREWEPGCQPDELYDAFLPAWRASLRGLLVRRLRNESTQMADWQKRVRSEARDRYFYWTAVFGTHTFFMMFLPILFFFGHPLEGRGLLHVVGLGIYISSFAKDLVCTPRPYSPPVIRLSMSTHHHEYGFPSSHSTNSVSIALYLGQWMFKLQDRLGWPTVLFSWLMLAVYMTSVIGGRVYTGMHSIADIVGGSIMGVACWLFWIAVGDRNETWVNSGSWTVPAIIAPLGFILIRCHPQPFEACPCFEDAIAVLAVMLGSTLGQWFTVAIWPSIKVQNPTAFYSYNLATIILSIMFRLVFGLGTLFAWRLFAKYTLHQALPPVFRSCSLLLHTSLPARRFYISTAEHNTESSQLALRAIPSLLDLQTGENTETHSAPSCSSPLFTSHALNSRNAIPTSPSSKPGEGLTMRKKSPRENGTERKTATPGEEQAPKSVSALTYDVEVATKVGVYSGIGFIATVVVPYWFELIENIILG